MQRSLREREGREQNRENVGLDRHALWYMRMLRGLMRGEERGDIGEETLARLRGRKSALPFHASFSPPLHSRENLAHSRRESFRRMKTLLFMRHVQHKPAASFQEKGPRER